MNICALIPAHNESRNIGGVIDGLKAKGLDVLVIDDGSSDGTDTIARQKGAHVIRHDRKAGKGRSLQEGFDYALRHGYDGVITVDGDGQHDVNDIGRFLTLAGEHRVSVVTGNRMADTKGMPFIRYCTNRFMSWLISLACRQNIEDTQCGYRYISCDILREIRLTCNGYEIESEILLKACKRGFKVYSVPIKTIYSDEVSNINPFIDTARFFVYFIKEICSPAK
ncbi:MAG: hypothetical protein A3C36_05185 [Omnitrophica WOR_2 bacterium RIFCSPHIGHO2_02_FULL_52_10]|nr:MAG: hypothetical protein A3C36_05185 [Omnitrophica WOR_2 bacterium RIFCSPHIGHO2_02_FULL_52_10]